MNDLILTGAKTSAAPKKVLIVNCYFPEVRLPVKLVNEVPNALAPVFLAGAFARRQCDVRLYNEVTSGFLEVFHPELLEWPDMVVFTDLTAAFDRMLHLTAYLRSRNPDIITVAGGIAIRGFRHYAANFFDYVCVGDAEEIRDVVLDAWGPGFAAEHMTPRYDLAYWMRRRIGYLESSRNCNFRCTFCVLTADGHRYKKQSLDHMREQIVALGKRDLLFFQDNQFHGGDREFFLNRMQLLRELRKAGHFRYWSAFVTDSFFWNDDDVAAAAEAGCFSLFVGVESFDEVWLRRVNKTQNSRYSQTDLIRKCCDAGILFQYGLVFDPTERTVEDMHREMTAICDNPEIPAPNFIFMAIPLPGTPFFRDRFERGLLLPNTKIRDLEGSTLSTQPLDGVDAVGHFIATGKNFKGYGCRLVTHQARFLWRYRRALGAIQATASSLCVTSILAPSMVSNPRYAFRRMTPRTHVSTTDRLDLVYRPRHRVDAVFRSYFEPTMITDSEGALNEDLVDDLLATRYKVREAVH